MKKYSLVGTVALFLCLLCGCSSSNYEKAIIMVDNREYEQACAAFEKLGDYEDAPAYLNYAKAMALAEAGDYQGAGDLFRQQTDFLDSAVQSEMCKYRDYLNGDKIYTLSEALDALNEIDTTDWPLDEVMDLTAYRGMVEFAQSQEATGYTYEYSQYSNFEDSVKTDTHLDLDVSFYVSKGFVHARILSPLCPNGTEVDQELIRSKDSAGGELMTTKAKDEKFNLILGVLGGTRAMVAIFPDDSRADHETYMFTVDEKTHPELESSGSEATAKCSRCNGTGYQKYYYGSSDLEAVLSGHDTYTTGVCGSCGGTGKAG